MCPHCYIGQRYRIYQISFPFIWESSVLFFHLLLQLRQKCITDEKLYLWHSLESKMTVVCPVQVVKLTRLMKNIVIKQNKRCFTCVRGGTAYGGQICMWKFQTGLQCIPDEISMVWLVTEPKIAVVSIIGAAKHKYLFHVYRTHLNGVKQTRNSTYCTFF